MPNSEQNDGSLSALPFGLAGLASLCCVGLATLAGGAALTGGTVAGATAVSGGIRSIGGLLVTVFVTALTVGVIGLAARWRPSS